MKSIRKQLKPISLFMAFLVLVISCQQYDETPISKDFSAKDVFKSVMFGTGEFASNLSIFDAQQKSVENIETAQREEMLKNIELLVNAIESKNPNYFNAFKEQIKSKNHNDIQFAIKEGGQHIENNLKAIIPNYETFYQNVKSDIANKKDDFKTIEDVNNYVSNLQSNNNELLHKNMITSESALSPCTWAIACVVYFVLAAHNTVAVAANVYLVFALWGPNLDNPTLKVESDDTLREEMLVEEITNIQW